MSHLFEIEGLHWEGNWRASNGGKSYVIPFPTMRPFNVVFHGDHQFDYGHYGIHLGQEDRLTFLGSEDLQIIGYFIDCRKESPSFRKKEIVHFTPSSARKLVIPPGVAHAFDNLHKITTINSYQLFLPDPQRWLNGQTEWDHENDVINLPMFVDESSVEGVEVNSYPASDVFYGLISEKQKHSIPLITHEYPFTEDFVLDNGEKVRLRLRKRRPRQSLAKCRVALRKREVPVAVGP